MHIRTYIHTCVCIYVCTYFQNYTLQEYSQDVSNNLYSNKMTMIKYLHAHVRMYICMCMCIKSVLSFACYFHYFSHKKEIVCKGLLAQFDKYVAIAPKVQMNF